MNVYVVTLCFFGAAFTAFKLGAIFGAVFGNRGRRLLWDIEAALCIALRGVKVPTQRGAGDEENSDTLTLARRQVRDLQELHYEIQNYLKLKANETSQETENPAVPIKADAGIPHAFSE
jgi:hypothetical protein